MTEKTRPKVLTIGRLPEDVSMDFSIQPGSPNKRNTKPKDELSLRRDNSDFNLLSSRITPRSLGASPNRSLVRSNTKAKISSILEAKDDIIGNLRSATKKKNSKAVRLDIDKKNTTMGEIEENAKPVKKEADYTSLLMYVPQNIQSFSAKNSTSKTFLSFGELAKTTKNSHNRLFQGILKENEEFKYKTEEATGAERIGLMKKVLDFNQKQKNDYVQQIQAERKHVLLPLIKQVQKKARKGLQVKVLPSRKLMEEQAAAAMEGQGITAPEDLPMGFFYRASAPTSPLNSSRKRDTDKTPSAFKQQEVKIEEQAFSVTYRVFWNYNPTNRTEWKPDVREGHTFTAVGKYVVLYGGLSNSLIDDISVYDPARNFWVKPKMNGDVPKVGRHGHTACEFNKQLVIFGGEQQFNATLHIRDCLNDVHLYNLEKSEWKYIKPPANNLQPRRYHTAAIFDKSMFIYGGINNEGIYMRDLWSLNLKSFVWEKVDISSDRENGIAFHTMTACFVEKNSHNKDRDKLRVPEEGLYVFGGKDGQGKVLNTLKIFNMDLKAPQWKYPTVKGVPPTPRYNHSTLFYAPLGLLIVYGGKNDHLYGSTNNICLSDIRIFNLEHMAWANTSSHGDTSRVGRCLHAVAGSGSKMLIFGGVEFCQYASDDVVTIELSQSKVKKILDMNNQEDSTTFDNPKKSYSKLPRSRQRNRSENHYEIMSNDDDYGIRPMVSFLPMPKASDENKAMKQKIGSSLRREKSSSTLSKAQKSGDFA